MKKLLGLVLTTTLCATTMLAAQRHPQHHSAEGPAPIHNGLWWQNKSEIFRDGFMTGYKSGSSHVAGHPIGVNEFPASELIDGLNSFYKDFRNRNILVDDALTYVQDQLHGVSDEKLSAEVLKMRAASAPTNEE